MYLKPHWKHKGNKDSNTWMKGAPMFNYLEDKPHTFAQWSLCFVG